MRLLAPLLRRSFGLSATSMCRSGLLASGNTVAKYYDSTTWPKHWTATDIEALLRDNLAKSGVAPDYDRLVVLHRSGDIKSLNVLLHKFVKPQEVNVEEYFTKHVHKAKDIEISVQSHQHAFDSINMALLISNFERTIVVCKSPSGAGTTTFLKHFVSTKRAEAMKCGRVIVRCCDVAIRDTDDIESSWIAQVLKAATNSIDTNLTSGFCDLIRTHVEAVTGRPQVSSAYCDTHTAYATWMSETAIHFKISEYTDNVDPLIILDSCEILSNHDYVHRSTGKLYSLLEVLCLQVPSPYAIVVMGSDARIGVSDPGLLAIANVTNIDLTWDPDTWPSHWTATDIEALLKDNISSSVPKPSYETLAEMLRSRDIHSIKVILRSLRTQPTIPEVTFDECVSKFISKSVDPPNMELQGRMTQLDTLDKVLSVQPDQKKQVAFCYAPRGSGKTQLLMHFVSTKRADAMKCGRIIVRCCEKPDVRNASWFQSVINGMATQGLCDLVREHVQSITGKTQELSKYSNPQVAYETWISETARRFGNPSSKQHVDPLIILDACENLAEPNDPQAALYDGKTTDTLPEKRLSLLERFCDVVPSPYCIFVIGCSANIVSNSVSGGSDSVNVTKINPLAPLSKKQFAAAISAWKEDNVNPAIFLPLYHWTGGLPRLLRLAYSPKSLLVRLTEGHINVLKERFETYKLNVEKEYPLQAKWFPHAYTCFLASSTKLKVSSTDLITVKPAWKKQANHALTYEDAAAQSIGAYDPNTRLFMVPPITFVDGVVPKDTKAVPILPSRLHPFLGRGVVKHFGKDNALERGIQFEKPYMFAVYARYLLTRWANSNKRWVSLEKIFDGAVHGTQKSVLSKYEANLSDGVRLGDCCKKKLARKNAVTYLGGSAKHDAYLWCRKKQTNDKVPNKRKQKKKLVAVPLQLRHGKPKTPAALIKQLEGSEILLSVNQQRCNTMKKHINRIVMVDASAMSSISWLWLISRRHKNRKRSKKQASKKKP
ncbi:Bodo-specific multi-copy gene family, putative [Bodo saltans]|uniref:Bodo-specific multi-copy gene family, putative n=1 Tax=Bodo saltans TaxID=75058 RepID=A0A0S4JD83_BODSA|nr:Bodo-specific multi-copy gene family, putative [Bodo saltans]|eukprot:CUG88210.1 Bodo-specific multi-copy gene family, putative [Bodo saltans]